MLIEQATWRGRSLALNGVCGNFGVAFAAAMTATLIYLMGWRAAFLVPAVICIVTGIIYLSVIPDDRHRQARRSSSPEVVFPPRIAATIFALFILIAISAGLVFHITTIALPKIVDERVGLAASLVQVGGIATVVLMFGALAQFSIGRVVDKWPLHLLFAAVAILQFVGVVWTAYARGPMLIVALAVAVAAIYAQVTVNDLVIARYTADAWRARIYSVRYFVTFLASGASASLIAYLHGRGGFDLVLSSMALIALGFVVGTWAIAILVNGAEKERARIAQPAE
jgi:MFS family permease